MTDKVNFDEYANNYDEMLKKQHRFFDANEDYFSEYKVAYIKRVLKDALCRKILDFGCGTGRTIGFLQKYFPASSVSGSDISEQSLEIAKKKFPAVAYYHCDELVHSGRKFDLIFLSGVLHHVAPEKRAAMMKDLVGMLAPEGHLVVFEHNPYNPVTRHMVNTCPLDSDAVLLKPRELKRLFAEAGILAGRCDYTLFFPSMLGWLRVLEPCLKRIPLGGQYMLLGQYGVR